MKKRTGSGIQVGWAGLCAGTHYDCSRELGKGSKHEARRRCEGVKLMLSAEAPVRHPFAGLRVLAHPRADRPSGAAILS